VAATAVARKRRRLSAPRCQRCRFRTVRPYQPKRDRVVMLAAMTASESRSLFRDPAFSRLWFVQASTQVGGNMALYALTVLVFETTRSNAAVSALVASFVLPTILLSWLAGAIVDRLDIRLAMLFPNILRMLLTVGLALAGGNVTQLLALNLGISLTTVMLTPAEGSMIPRVVKRHHLETASGVFNLTLQGSFAVGFAFLGPLLVAISNPSAVLVVVAFLYAGATIAILGLPSAPPKSAPPGVAGRALHELVEHLREGFAAIARDREVSRPLLHQATSVAVITAIGTLGPGLATAVGLEPDDLVVVVLPLGVGVVAGVLGLRRFGGGISRRRAGEGGLIGFGLMTLAVGAVAWAMGGSGLGPVVLLVVALAFLAGAAYAVTSVSAQTALFENLPADVRGRVFGVLASIVSAASLAPTIVAGPLADRISAPAVAMIIGAIAVLAGLASARFLGAGRMAS
jgi:MFS family permease